MPDPQKWPDQAPSYSIDVPTVEGTPPTPAGLPKPGSAYLRVGAMDRSNARELAYYDGQDITLVPPGIVMWSPSDLKQIAVSTTTMKSSVESLSVSSANTQIVSATYSYAETGAFRDVSYRLGHATGWSIGDSQSWRLASSTDIGISNGQSVSVGAGVKVGASSDVGISIGILAVAADKDGVEVRSPFGGFKTATVSKLAASSTVSIAVTPAATVLLKKVSAANDLMLRVTALLSALSGGLMTGMGVPVMNSVGSMANEAAIKEWSRHLGNSGLAELAMLSTAQAMYVALGTYAVASQSAPQPGTFPTIKMDSTSIELSTGVSTLTLDATGIRMLVGLSESRLQANSALLSSASVNLSAGTAAIGMSARALTAEALNVTIEGHVSAGVRAPSIAFGA